MFQYVYLYIKRMLVFVLGCIFFVIIFKTITTPVREVVYLDIKLYHIEAVESKLPVAAKIAIGLGATALGIGGAIIGAPLILSGAGFTSTGIAAGSLASAWQATIGNVFGGSTFALLQSTGIIGLSSTSIAVVSAVGATAGGAAGIILAGGVEKHVSLLDLENSFRVFKNEKDLVNYDDLEDMLTSLDLNLRGRELKEAYTRVTGRVKDKPITYEEFLRLFGVKLLKGQELKDKLTEEFTSFSYNQEITLDELEEMLSSLGVNIFRRDIEDSFLYATRNSHNVKEVVSLETFLKMCRF